MIDPAAVRAMPKVELHVHLEGSIRPETVLKLARRNGVALPADDVEGLREWYRFTDFPHFLQVYVAVSKCIRTPDDIELIAREFLVGQAEQNVLHSEVTYTASTMEKYAGIPWDEQLDALNRARHWAERDLGVTIRYVLDIVYGDTPERGVQVAEWCVAGKDKGVVALGLGGPEAKRPASDYREAFELIHQEGLAAVPHAGEVRGPESVWDALGANNPVRIGHGVRSVEDPSLLEELRCRRITLEVSPTSNILLGVFPTMADHSLPRLIEAGIPVTINSDDPPMFNTTLTDEYLRVADTFGYDLEMLQGFVRTAVESSLLRPDEKETLRSRLQAKPV